MKFSEIKVGQKFKHSEKVYVKVSSDSGFCREKNMLIVRDGYHEVELITSCNNCRNLYIEDTPPHNDNKQAYKCGHLNVWIEKVKYLGGGQSDIREDVETFCCVLFEQAK